MNACPNCASEMRFDIATQSLLCPHCGTKENPQTYSAFGAFAEEYGTDPEEMDAILYSCPQCGGSIYSTESSVNGFCSYCGANVTLKSRMVKMKYPRYVAPFRIDKEECKKRYLAYAKKAFFAPKELKNPEYPDRFRGIYMTYWGYNVHMEGYLALDGKRDYVSLPYHYTECYKCSGWVNAEYKGIFFDASSTFEDHYSEQVAPFNYHALVKFNPAYLSGFYADLPDLSDEIYEENAINLSKDNLFRSSQLRKSFPGMNFDEEQKERFRSTMDAYCSETYTVFFPIWFLSYRHKDDMACAVVNGQTGRIVSDFPVSEKKFLLFGFLLALPLFLLFSLLPTFSLSALLIISDSFAVFSMVLLVYLLQKVHIHRLMLDDKGYLSKSTAYDYQFRYHLNELREAKRKKKKNRLPLILGIVIVLALLSYPLQLGLNILLTLLGGLSPLTALVLCIILELLILKNGGTILRYMGKGRVPLLMGMILTFFSSIYGTYLLFSRSRYNHAMYVVILLILLGTVISQLCAVGEYNRMVCRPLPQLMREGGEYHD